MAVRFLRSVQERLTVTLFLCGHLLSVLYLHHLLAHLHHGLLHLWHLDQLLHGLHHVSTLLQAARNSAKGIQFLDMCPIHSNVYGGLFILNLESSGQIFVID